MYDGSVCSVELTGSAAWASLDRSTKRPLGALFVDRAALAHDRGYTVEEKQIPREALYIADELFFTGTAAEVTPIRSVDKYTIGAGKRGPVTKELQDAFFDVIHRGNDPHGWLTPVPVATQSSNGTPVESAVEGIV